MTTKLDNIITKIRGSKEDLIVQISEVPSIFLSAIPTDIHYELSIDTGDKSIATISRWNLTTPEVQEFYKEFEYRLFFKPYFHPYLYIEGKWDGWAHYKNLGAK